MNGVSMRIERLFFNYVPLFVSILSDDHYLLQSLAGALLVVTIAQCFAEERDLLNIESAALKDFGQD